MFGRIPLLTLLLASLVFSADASARGSGRDAAIAGAVVGAVIGGVIVANSRYERAPVYVEIGPLPHRYRYYEEPYPDYYSPRPYYRSYPRVVVPHYGYRPHQYKHQHRQHYHRHHRHHRHGHYRPRW
ncbi:hypothetical protein ACSX1C_12415 [Pseudomonas sp. MBLB4123]|uniref:hypothetical protein n=1 Tax=Pseudomonas sp. MBLB4123 TaxID=3451557 RepID=UPI003F755CA8